MTLLCSCLAVLFCCALVLFLVLQVRDNALVVSAEYVRIIITCDKVCGGCCNCTGGMLVHYCSQLSGLLH